MRFYEIVCKANIPSGLCVNTFWYRDIAAGEPTETDLADVRTLFDRDFVPKFKAAMSNQWQLQEISVYGYNEQWARVPYLPLIYPNVQTGGMVTAQVVPYNAIIYSCRVEPQQASQKRDANGQVINAPVRRGYLSISPVSDDWMDNLGQVSGTGYIQLAAMMAFRDQIKAELFGAEVVTPLQPIRVGQPGKDLTQRGYGLIKDVVIRPYGSTRRSRMFGKGA